MLEIFFTGAGLMARTTNIYQCLPQVVWPEKMPNVYKSCPNMISLEKFTPLQKLPKNLGDLGKLVVA